MQPINTGDGLPYVSPSYLAKGVELWLRRWVVERTFSWLYHYRRLSKDYEVSIESSTAFVYIAMINLMLNRLANNTSTNF